MILLRHSPKRLLRLLALAGLLLSSAAASRLHAQSSLDPAAAPSSTSNGAGPAAGASNFGRLPIGADGSQPSLGFSGAAAPDSDTLSSLGASQAQGAPLVLSADQIFTILQEQPDAMVELKSLMADLSQQQGASIQPDSITDEMLYNNVASSPDLRANITTFLRARGYITDSTLQDYATTGDRSLASSPLQGSSPQGTNIDRMTASPGAFPRTPTGQYALDGRSPNPFGARPDDTTRLGMGKASANEQNDRNYDELWRRLKAR